MSITHDTTKFLTVWCLVIACLGHALPLHSTDSTFVATTTTPPVSNSTNATRASNSSASQVVNTDALCQPIAAPSLKPKRASVYYRMSAMTPGRVSGCVDETLLHSPPTRDAEKAEDLLVAIHLRQFRAEHGGQFAINVRVSPPSDGFSGRLTLVLHSTSPMEWRLDLSSLGPPRGRRHKVVLTHKGASFYSEQMHAERLLDLVRMPSLGANDDQLHPVKETSLKEDSWERLRGRLAAAKLGRLAFLVSVAQTGADGKEDLTSNAVDVRLPRRRHLTAPAGGLKPGCQDANATRLARLAEATLESSPEAGFASCRSHCWEEAAGCAGPGGRGRAPRRLLQLVEFSREFRRRRRAIPAPAGMEMRLTAPASDTEGAAERVIVAVFSWINFTLRVDTRALRRPVELVSNLHVDFIYPEHQHAELVNYTHVQSLPSSHADAMVAFHAELRRRLTGGLGAWSVERLNFTRPMQINMLYRSPSLVTLRLHEAPLLLRDLEPWVATACFDTKDMVVGVPRRPFDALGLAKVQVLLGGLPWCSLYENATHWWLRKVLLNGEERCSTDDKNLGSHSILFNWLSLNTSTSLPPYRLSFECNFVHNNGMDLPEANKQDNPDYLWQTYSDSTHSYRDGSGRSTSGQTSADDFLLQLFLDRDMHKPLGIANAHLRTSQRLYGRVLPAHQRVEAGLMVRDCLLSGSREAHPSSNVHRHYMVHHGCEMGAYFVWDDTDSFRVKTFSFELPRPSFFSAEASFYLHCYIQPCNYFQRRDGLPRCWNQHYICQFPNTPAPLHLVAGPFASSAAGNGSVTEVSAEVSGIPLWGAFVIAIFAFIVGVVSASLLWIVHHVTRRRQQQQRRPPGVAVALCERQAEQERHQLLPPTGEAPGVYWVRGKATGSGPGHGVKLPALVRLWRSLVRWCQRRHVPGVPLPATTLPAQAIARENGGGSLAMSTTTTTNTNGSSSGSGNQAAHLTTSPLV